MKPETTFVFDAHTVKALESMKATFGVTSNAAVLRRALALAQVAIDNAADDKSLTIIDNNNRRRKILLSQ